MPTAYDNILSYIPQSPTLTPGVQENSQSSPVMTEEEAQQMHNEAADLSAVLQDPSSFAIAAKAKTVGLSADEQAVISPQLYDYIYNRDYFDAKYGDQISSAMDEAAQQFMPDIQDDRSIAESVGDKALSLGWGLARDIGNLGALALKATGVGSDAALAINRGINQASDWVDENLHSDYYNQAKKASALRDIARDALVNLQDKKNEQAGDSETVRAFKKFGNQFLQEAKSFLEDEGKFESGFWENVPSFLLSGGIFKAGALGARAAAKAMPAVEKAAAKLAATKGGAIASKVVLNPEFIVNAVLESSGSISEAVATVDAMTPEELRKSDQFVQNEQAYKEQGLSDEEAFQQAKDDLAKSVSTYAGAITAPIAGIAGHIAGKALTRTPLKGLSTWNPLRAGAQVGTDMAREGTEETLQGAQTIGQNIGMQKAGYDVDLLYNVAKEAAAGGITGAAIGGAAPITGTALNAVKAAKQAFKNRGSFVAENTRQALDDVATLNQEIQNVPAPEITPETGENSVTNSSSSSESNEPGKQPISEQLKQFSQQYASLVEEAKTSPIEDINAALTDKRSQQDPLSEVTQKFIDPNKTVTENILAMQKEIARLAKSSKDEDHVAAKQMALDVNKLGTILARQIDVLEEQRMKLNNLKPENDGDKRFISALDQSIKAVETHLMAPDFNNAFFQKTVDKVNSLRGVTFFSSNILKKAAATPNPNDISLAQVSSTVTDILAGNQNSEQLLDDAIPAIDKVLQRTDLDESSRKMYSSYKDILSQRKSIVNNFTQKHGHELKGKVANVVKQVLSNPYINLPLGEKSKKAPDLEYLSLNGHLSKIISNIAQGPNKAREARISLQDLQRFTQNQVNKLHAMDQSYAMDKPIGANRKVAYAAYSKAADEDSWKYIPYEIYVQPRKKSSMATYRQVQLETELLLSTYNALAKQFSGSNAVEQEIFPQMTKDDFVTPEQAEQINQAGEDEKRNGEGSGTVVRPQMNLTPFESETPSATPKKPDLTPEEAEAAEQKEQECIQEDILMDEFWGPLYHRINQNTSYFEKNSDYKKELDKKANWIFAKGNETGQALDDALDELAKEGGMLAGIETDDDLYHKILDTPFPSDAAKRRWLDKQREKPESMPSSIRAAEKEVTKQIQKGQLLWGQKSIDPLTGKTYAELNGDKTYAAKEIFSRTGKVKESLIRSIFNRVYRKNPPNSQRNTVARLVQGYTRFIQQLTQNGTYTRTNRRGNDSSWRLDSLNCNVIAEYEMNKNAAFLYSANNMATPKFYELESGTEQSAKKFAESIDTSIKNNKHDDVSFAYSEEEYKQMRLFLSQDGTIGFAITKENEIVSIFSNSSGSEYNGGYITPLIECAISAGGLYLNTFETVLPEIYSRAGFRAIARNKWNDKLAPTNWNKEQMSKYYHGEPDVVFMVYDPNYFGGYTAKTDEGKLIPGDGQLVEGENAYDDAIKLQTKAIQKLHNKKVDTSTQQNQSLSNIPVLLNEELHDVPVSQSIATEDIQNLKGKEQSKYTIKDWLVYSYVKLWNLIYKSDENPFNKSELRFGTEQLTQEDIKKYINYYDNVINDFYYNIILKQIYQFLNDSFSKLPAQEREELLNISSQTQQLYNNSSVLYQIPKFYAVYTAIYSSNKLEDMWNSLVDKYKRANQLDKLYYDLYTYYNKYNSSKKDSVSRWDVIKVLESFFKNYPNPQQQEDIISILKNKFKKFRDSVYKTPNDILPSDIYDDGLVVDTIDGEIGQHFEAHGITKGFIHEQFDTLLNILQNGFDTNKALYTAPFEITDEQRQMAAATGTPGGTAYHTGLATLVADYNKSLEKDGIKVVFIADRAAPLIPELRKAFPNIRFEKLSDNIKVLNELAQQVQTNSNSKPHEQIINHIDDNPEHYYLHSGGAIGSDSYWNKIAQEYSIPEKNVKNYTTQYVEDSKDDKRKAYDKKSLGNTFTIISQEEYAEGIEKVREANKKLQRFDGKDPVEQTKKNLERYNKKKAEGKLSPKDVDPQLVLDLIVRDWMQVKNADAIFAIGEILTSKTFSETYDGETYSRTVDLNPQVAGGTGWAVQMAIDNNKPVYVFDPKKNNWFTWDNTTQSFIQYNDVPTLTPHFAGIGTRGKGTGLLSKNGRKIKDIPDNAKQAIEDVFAKTFGMEDYAEQRKKLIAESNQYFEEDEKDDTDEEDFTDWSSYDFESDNSEDYQDAVSALFTKPKSVSLIHRKNNIIQILRDFFGKVKKRNENSLAIAQGNFISLLSQENKEAKLLATRIFHKPPKLSLGNALAGITSRKTLLENLQELFSNSDKSAIVTLTNAFNKELLKLADRVNDPKTSEQLHNLYQALLDTPFENDFSKGINDAKGRLLDNMQRKNIRAMSLFLTRDENGNLVGNNSYFQRALLGYISAYISKSKELIPGSEEHQEAFNDWEIELENKATLLFQTRYGNGASDEVLEYVRNNLNNSSSAAEFTNGLASMMKQYLGLREKDHIDANTLNIAATCFVQTMNDILKKNGILKEHQLKVAYFKPSEEFRKQFSIELPDTIITHITDNGKVVYSNSTPEFQNQKLHYDTFTFYQSIDPDSNSSNKLEQGMATAYAIGSSILDKIFLSQNNESYRIGEVPPVDEYINHTETELSPNQKKSIEERQKKSYYFHAAMYNLLQIVGEEGIAKYLDRWIPQEKENGTSDINQYADITKISKQGKRTNVHTSFLNLDYIFNDLISNPDVSYADAGLDNPDAKYDLQEIPIHFKYMIASTGRHMIRKGIHPQGDKILREVLLPEQYEIDLSKPNHRENYFRALAQAFGIKVQQNERIDKQPEKTIEEQVKEKLAQLKDSLEWQNFVREIQSDPELKELKEQQAIAIQSFVAMLSNGKYRNYTSSTKLESEIKDIDKTMVALHAFFDLVKIWDLEKQDIKTEQPHKSRFYLEADGISSGASNSILLFDTSLLQDAKGNPDHRRMRYMIRAGLGIGLTGSYAKIYKRYADEKDIYGALGYTEQEFINTKLDAVKKAIARTQGMAKSTMKSKDFDLPNDFNFYDESFDGSHKFLKDSRGRDATFFPGMIITDLSNKDETGQNIQNSIDGLRRFTLAYNSILTILTTLNKSGIKEVSGIKSQKDILEELNNFLISRNFIKGPLTQIQYGAGSKTVAQAIIKGVEEAIAQKITDRNLYRVHGDNAKTDQLQKEIETCIKAINTLMRNQFTSYKQKINKTTGQPFAIWTFWNKNSLPEPAQIDLEKDFNKGQRNFNLAKYADSLSHTFDCLITKPLKDQIDNDIYGPEFVKNKKLLVGMSNIMTIMSGQLFIEKLKALIQENKGYTPAQYRHIKDLLKKWDPLIHNQIMAYVTTQSSEENILDHEEIKQTFNMFKQDFMPGSKLGTPEYGGSLQNPNSKQGEASIFVPQPAGVSILPKTVQGMAETVIMQIMSLRKATGLDVYDGFNMPINQVDNLAQLANEAVYNAWINTNVFKNMGEAIDSFFKNMAKDELAQKMLSKIFVYHGTEEEYDNWAETHPVQDQFFRAIFDLTDEDPDEFKENVVKKFGPNQPTNTKPGIIPREDWLYHIASARQLLAEAAQKVDIKHFLLKHLTDISVDQMGGAARPFIHHAEYIDYVEKDGKKIEVPFIFKDKTRFERLIYDPNTDYDKFMEEYAKRYTDYTQKLMHEDLFNISKYESKFFNKIPSGYWNYSRFARDQKTLAQLALSDVKDLNTKTPEEALRWAFPKLAGPKEKEKQSLLDKNYQAVINNLQGSLIPDQQIKVVMVKSSDLDNDLVKKYFGETNLSPEQIKDIHEFTIEQSKGAATFITNEGKIVILVRDNASFLSQSADKEAKKEADKHTARDIVHELIHAQTLNYLFDNLDENGNIINNSLPVEQKANLRYLTQQLRDFKNDVLDENGNYRDHVPAELQPFLDIIFNTSTDFRSQLAEFMAYGLAQPELQTFLQEWIVEPGQNLISHIEDSARKEYDKNNKTKEKFHFIKTFLKNLQHIRKAIVNFLDTLFHFRKKDSTFADNLRWSTTFIMITQRENYEQNNPLVNKISKEHTFWATNPTQDLIDKLKKQHYPNNRLLAKIRQIQQWAKENADLQLNDKADFNYLTDAQNSTTYQIIQNVSSLFGLTDVQRDDFTDAFTLILKAFQKDKAAIQRSYGILNSLIGSLTKDTFSGTITEKNKKYALIMSLPKMYLEGNINRSIAVPMIIALSQVSPELENILSKIPVPQRYKKQKDDTLNDVIRGIGNDLLSKFDKVLSGEKGKMTNEMEAAANIIKTSTAIAHDAKVRWSDYLNTSLNDALSRIDIMASNSLYTASEWIRDRIIQMQPASSRLGRAAQGVIQGTALAATSIFNEQQGDVTNKFIRQGINSSRLPEPIRRLLHDMFNPADDSLADFYLKHKQVKSLVDQQKNMLKINLPQEIVSWFKEKPTDEEWESMHLSLGRTDASCLGNDIDYLKIADWVSDPKELLKEIAGLESQLPAEVRPGSYGNQKAKQLAHFMVTGEAGTNLIKNPYAICVINGIPLSKDQLTVFDKLITLYAIEELPAKDKKILLKQFNTNKDAMIKLLNNMNTHRQIEYQGKQDLLTSKNKSHTVEQYQRTRMNLNYYKGYIPTVRTDGTQLIVGDKKDMKMMQENGFMPIDTYEGSFDPHSQKVYYYADYNQHATFNEGLIRIVHSTYNGISQDVATSLEGVAYRIWRPSQNESQQAKARFDQLVSNMYAYEQSGKIESKTHENLVPIYDINNKGELRIIAFEARMNPDKINLIQNKRKLSDMIGMWASRQQEELLAKELNQSAADILVNIYNKASDKEKQTQFVDLNDFAHLTRTQQDAVRLIPWDVWHDLEKAFKSTDSKGKIMIRRDMLIDAIGERSASVADIFTQASNIDPDTMKKTKKYLLHLLGPKAFNILMTGEQILQGAVSLARNIIVVKSVRVMILNNIGNLWHLGACGVPFKTIFKELPRILSQAEKYAQSFKKLSELQARLDASRDSEERAKLESQIALKEAEIRDMDIYPILHEFSTLEDLGRTEDDLKLTRGKMGEWIDEQVKKHIPAKMMKPLKYIFLTKDTAIYQFLEKATQYGDFVAKGILYKHLIEKENYTQEEALKRINNEFVNYDKNPGRMRSYLENSGIMWFFNYKLRILPVAFRLLREHPVRALFLTMFPQWTPVGDAGNVISDSFLGKLFGGGLGNAFGFNMLFHAFGMHPMSQLFL